MPHDAKFVSLDMLDSYLGTDPVCDRCHKLIQLGDKVSQTTSGTVMFDRGEGNEMGIKESHYMLVHIDCNNPTL